ncbi:hypothetical protein DID88_009832 [Monilinia fructigena]|uniref:Uncharacterized protein n=1 Tax=Monilinia fructigena TaxID=38457 RepID=A0A395IKN6_9HELO|nr:hypothetical protein DID88_009832 [Monilinia fructigena]
MKGRPMRPLISSGFPSRATPDIGDDSHSSTSNSPARADYEESDFFTGNNDSQSSIGVPTFQDMAVTETCISASNRLPAEVSHQHILQAHESKRSAILFASI